MMNSGHDVRDALQRWMRRMHQDYGDKSGQAIVKSFLEECGGCRLRVPDLYDLYRLDRDRIIKNKFNGANYEELAINFNLSVWQIRRIIKNGK